MALRLMRVCVCGHGRETHQNPLAVPPTDSQRCQYVEWDESWEGEARRLSVRAACHCTWWRPLLFPRVRNVPLERPAVLKRSA